MGEGAGEWKEREVKVKESHFPYYYFSLFHNDMNALI